MDKRIVVQTNHTFVNHVAHAKMAITLVKIKELVSISGFKFYNWHYYDEENGNLHQWSSPTRNLDSDYRKYRKELNLMFPNQIKRLRKRYGLSQRELSSVFGISYSTLSDIENGNYIQSVAQNNILRNLLKPELMYSLIKSNLRRIRLIKPNHVNSDVLAHKAKKISKSV